MGGDEEVLPVIRGGSVVRGGTMHVVPSKSRVVNPDIATQAMLQGVVRMVPPIQQPTPAPPQEHHIGEVS